MKDIEFIKITKEEFEKLDEKNLIFITNPGRMGDTDGSNFIVKIGNVFYVRDKDFLKSECYKENKKLKEENKKLIKENEELKQKLAECDKCKTDVNKSTQEVSNP